MFWDKKDKKEAQGLPDLPSPPMSRPQLPPIRIENINSKPALSELPSLNAHMEESKEFSPRTKIPELPRFREPSIVELESPRDTEEFEVVHPRMPITHMAEQETNSIFVKLDKFKSAKASMADINEKLKEMDDLLKVIRDIRVKEESELDFWEKETQDLKSRLDLIIRDLFEKTE